MQASSGINPRVALAGALFLVLGCVPCVAALIVYDSFSYTNDRNYYKDGGFGWSGPWGGLFTLEGLNYNKNSRPLGSQGGSAFLNAPTIRHLDISSSSLLARYVGTNGVVGKDGMEIWLSFLVRATQLNYYSAGIWFGSTFALRLTNGMTQLAPGVPLILDTDYLVIEHIRFGTNSADVREEHLNPIPGLSSPAGAQGTNITSGNMRFTPTITLGGSIYHELSSEGMVDELRIGESYADVAPLTLVILTNIQSSAGALSFSFQSLTGLSHTIETRPSLDTGSWTDLTNFLGNGSAIQVTVPTTNSSTQFFRVRTE